MLGIFKEGFGLEAVGLSRVWGWAGWKACPTVWSTPKLRGALPKVGNVESRCTIVHLDSTIFVGQGRGLRRVLPRVGNRLGRISIERWGFLFTKVV